MARADSRVAGPASIATSNRWILRYVAATEPSGPISTLVMYGRSGSGLASATLPSSSHAECSRASAANGSVWGPGTEAAAAR